MKKWKARFFLSDESLMQAYFQLRSILTDDNLFAPWNYNTRNTCVISFFARKITFINLMTAIDSTNDQNTMCRVI